MCPDHPEVTESGVPRLDVTLEDVGLAGGSQSCDVGGPIPTKGTPAILCADFSLAA